MPDDDFDISKYEGRPMVPFMTNQVWDPASVETAQNTKQLGEVVGELDRSSRRQFRWIITVGALTLMVATASLVVAIVALD